MKSEFIISQFFPLVCKSDSDCMEANQVCATTSGECVCEKGYKLTYNGECGK